MLDINKIYQGDCIEVMKDIDDKCIDLIVTSPPYNIGLKYDELMQDNLTDEKYIQFTKNYLKECYRILKDDGRFCLNIGYKVSTVKGNGIDFMVLLNIIKKIGYTLRETIIWVKSREKENPQSFCGANTAWGSWLSPSNPICRARMEFIFVLNKKYYKKQIKGKTDLTKQEFMDYSSNVWYFPAEIDRTHKAPYPIELANRCIKFYSWIGDIVFDPFVGSGTTSLAAKKLKRNYIGIELNPRYVEQANQRLRQEILL